MARDYFINGETLVLVKGRADSAIGSLQQLGLSDAPIAIRMNFHHKDIGVDAYGATVPETQVMGGDATISMTLVHFDRSVLATCVNESLGGATAEGLLQRAGSRMGNNLPRFGAGGFLGNHYIGLNLTSVVAGIPWRFYYTFLANPPVEFPLGTEKSIVRLQWRAIGYTVDPWNGGLGSLNQPIFDHILDT